MLAAQYDRPPVEQWLAAVGAHLVEDAHGPQAEFAGPAATAVSGGGPSSRICPLPDLGVIQVSGPDARAFLHGQLSNDLEKLLPGQWRRFAYCNAKGRMQMSALGFCTGEDITLVCTRTLAAALAKRLSMFVLRAKAKVQDVSARFEIYGVLGQAEGLLQRLAPQAALPDAGGRWQSAAQDPVPVDLLVLPEAAQAWPGQQPAGPRSLWLTPAGSGLWSQAMALGMQPAPSLQWRLAEIAQGEARIVPATHECFVPQMLNFESIGGVDFRKGCYPGQEVVARSQYLGKLKRRMFIGWLPAASVPVPALPAGDVWPQPTAPDASPAAVEPAGQIVMSAPVAGQGCALLFECQTAAALEGKVGLRDDQGQWQAIALRPLPYALLEI